ncbi:MAG: polysaccharide biosynthesis protein [Actinobacteria bacterium]|nr:polysaccharide biosynthesis protein [Actinomycetota bacterium]
MNWLMSSDARMRRASVAIWDTAAWFFATLALAGARYDFILESVQWHAALMYPIAAGVLMIVTGYGFGLYRGHYKVGSFYEAFQLATTAVSVALLLAVPFLFFVPNFPRGLALSVPAGALLLMATARWLLRASRDRTPTAETEEKEPVVIYGAGFIGNQVGDLIRSTPDAPYRVVGYLDDDTSKRRLHLAGTRVVGTGEDLEWAAANLGAKTVILGIVRAADDQFLRELTSRTDALGLKLLVIPTFEEIVRSGYVVQLSQLHEVDVEDLMGRRPIHTDISAIADYLSGRVVLITGAGGSIGSELARQVHRFGPSELVLLDRDESGLHAVQLSIYGRGLLDTPDMVLADIREAEVVDRVFEVHKPEVVFHAAALKHLPMLEQYPQEGWKTNVLGTLNVLEAARRHGVKHFVNISTDKAADATSVLGKTKRAAEELTAWFAEQGAGSYLSVRFGNVLGSRGSMLYTFTSQIAAGGPVTVTHPDITRFFMTIPEASELVIQAAAIGDPGDVLVLDMGEPIKILDVAKRLIIKSGRRIEIVFTGLRPGEKLHEVLFSTSEAGTPTSHPLISHVQVPALDPTAVRYDARSLVRLDLDELRD